MMLLVTVSFSLGAASGLAPLRPPQDGRIEGRVVVEGGLPVPGGTLLRVYSEHRMPPWAKPTYEGPVEASGSFSIPVPAGIGKFGVDVGSPLLRGETVGFFGKLLMLDPAGRARVDIPVRPAGVLTVEAVDAGDARAPIQEVVVQTRVAPGNGVGWLNSSTRSRLESS